MEKIKIYNMKLYKENFDKVVSEEKKIEVRLLNDKTRKINKNDYIRFTCFETNRKILTRVSLSKEHCCVNCLYYDYQTGYSGENPSRLGVPNGMIRQVYIDLYKEKLLTNGLKSFQLELIEIEELEDYIKGIEKVGK